MNQLVKKQQFTGLVISDKMDKTVVVKVGFKKRHAKYKKTYSVFKKFKAHNAENQFHTGDTVLIEAIRPMSKEKKFAVVKKI
jgi:small subunit ribosomal protein S17